MFDCGCVRPERRSDLVVRQAAHFAQHDCSTRSLGQLPQIGNQRAQLLACMRAILDRDSLCSRVRRQLIAHPAAAKEGDGLIAGDTEQPWANRCVALIPLQRLECARERRLNGVVSVGLAVQDRPAVAVQDAVIALVENRERSTVTRRHQPAQLLVVDQLRLTQWLRGSSFPSYKDLPARHGPDAVRPRRRPRKASSSTVS